MKKEREKHFDSGKDIERILWSGIGEKFKFYFVDWNVVCSRIKCGVLGEVELFL